MTNPMPTNPDQVYRDEAEKIVETWEGTDVFLDFDDDARANLVSAIASALAARGGVREGHVRLPDGLYKIRTHKTTAVSGYNMITTEPLPEVE